MSPPLVSILVAVLGLQVAALACVVFRRRPALAFAGLWATGLFGPWVALRVGSGAARVIELADQGLIAIAFVVALKTHLESNRRSVGPIGAVVVLAVLGMASAAAATSTLTSQNVLGGWIALKLWVLVFTVGALVRSAAEWYRLERYLLLIGGVLAAGGFIEAMIPQGFQSVVQSTAETSYRGALPSVRSFTVHPGFYSGAMSVCFAIMVCRKVANRWAPLWTIAVFGVAALLSLRIKAGLDIGAIMLVVGASRAASHQVRLVLAALVAGALLIFLPLGGAGVYREQADAYSGRNFEHPRQLLHDRAARIAVDHFPLGVGFGRYGSGPSTDPYSPVYSDYDLDDAWGLSEADPQYVSDTSWPTILGEAGVFGLGAALVSLAVLMRRAWRSARRQGEIVGAALLAALVADSLGGPGMFDTGMTFGAAFGLAAYGALRTRSGVPGSLEQDGEPRIRGGSSMPFAAVAPP